MEKVKIVLVEPAGALNIGSIARVMKNMALTQLVLVKPKCDHQGEEARLMAVHAQDVLDNAVIAPDLPTALGNCQRAIATTARSRAIPTDLETPKQALPWLIEDNLDTALIFGPEDRGLSNQELSYGQRFICIPSNPEYPSLNLAQAVSVCAYELYQEHLAKQNSVSSPPKIDNSAAYVNLLSNSSQGVSSEGVSSDSAPAEAVEAYYKDLESLLLEIGYLYPHTAAARMLKWRRLYNRANLKPEEVSMLRGMLRQIKWGMAQKP